MDTTFTGVPGGAHGYTGQQFNQTVSDAAGVDVGPLLHRLIATTQEIDYRRCSTGSAGVSSNADPGVDLEVRPDATREQRAHFVSLLARSKGPDGRHRRGNMSPSNGCETSSGDVSPAPQLESWGGWMIAGTGWRPRRHRNGPAWRHADHHAASA
jgi:hypothetical protein